MKRRTFLEGAAKLSAMGVAYPWLSACTNRPVVKKELFFDISLAQWSLHRQFMDGLLDPLDFAATAKERFDIRAVEYVNQFFKDKAKDKDYIYDLKHRAEDNGVRSLLIMVDDEGQLGNTDDKKRIEAVENHYQWVEAAEILGCHSIRVNAAGEGSEQDVKFAAVDGLSQLAEFAKDFNINVIVENHGGYSSNGLWLSSVLALVNQPNCGSLPDFGNFDEYDRYVGVEQLMPFAKGVSAKSFAFDTLGNETTIDYLRMLTIVKEARYRGYIGIEFEGETTNPRGEDDGVMATKALLQRVGAMIS